MSGKKRIILCVIGLFLVVPGIAIVIAYRDWPPNRAERLVDAAKKADLVRIYRLQGLPTQITPKKFPILPYDYEQTTYGSVDLTEANLAGFMGFWADFPVDDSRGALCHEPVYGFQFYTKDKLIFETSLCWACENFYVDTRFFGSNWIGFDSGSDISRALLQFCDELLPYDRGYEERVAKEREELIRSIESKESE